MFYVYLIWIILSPPNNLKKRYTYFSWLTCIFMFISLYGNIWTMKQLELTGNFIVLSFESLFLFLRTAKFEGQKASWIIINGLVKFFQFANCYISSVENFPCPVGVCFICSSAIQCICDTCPASMFNPVKPDRKGLNYHCSYISLDKPVFHGY